MKSSFSRFKSASTMQQIGGMVFAVILLAIAIPVFVWLGLLALGVITLFMLISLGVGTYMAYKNRPITVKVKRYRDS